jgi:hypothetical protein
MERFELPYYITVMKAGYIIRATRRGLVKQHEFYDTDGFRMVRIGLSRDRTQYVHRLVAEKYLPNPNDYDHVLFLDGDIKNCNYNNLEWCP